MFPRFVDLPPPSLRPAPAGILTDFYIYNSSQSLALGLNIVDVLRPIPHLRHNQRSAPGLCYNMTYATWRGLHFAPPWGLFRCSVVIKQSYQGLELTHPLTHSSSYSLSRSINQLSIIHQLCYLNKSIVIARSLLQIGCLSISLSIKFRLTSQTRLESTRLERSNSVDRAETPTRLRTSRTIGQSLDSQHSIGQPLYRQSQQSGKRRIHQYTVKHQPSRIGEPVAQCYYDWQSTSLIVQSVQSLQLALSRVYIHAYETHELSIRVYTTAAHLTLSYWSLMLQHRGVKPSSISHWAR